MTQPTNLPAIEKATGRTWEQWLAFLAGGEQLTHPNIVKKVYAELDGQIDSAGWWAQGIAVAYEQAIGRRMPGQRADGSFEVAVNKSSDGAREAIFNRVMQWAGEQTEFDGISIANQRTSITDKRSYWRCDLNDGSKVEVVVGPNIKSGHVLTITHSKLPTAEALEHWRAYWKNQIVNLI